MEYMFVFASLITGRSNKNTDTDLRKRALKNAHCLSQPYLSFYTDVDGEFGHFSETQSIFSEGIKALIFWFFCIKCPTASLQIR